MTSPSPSWVERALAPALGSFLPAQRWFAGRGRELRGLVVRQPVELHAGDPALLHVVAEVGYADGTVERYQVPLGVGSAPPADLAGDRVVGKVGDGLLAWDALADQRLTRMLLERMAGSAEIGGLRFTAARGEGGRLLAGVDLGASRPLGAEQSNTSVVVDGRLILKVFRQVVRGVNPELELTEALARHGFDAVARPVAWAEAVGEDAADPDTLAIVQPFHARSTEGWKLAVERSTAWHHGDDGATFAAEARQLGEVTGRLHAALAAAFPTVEPGPEELSEQVARQRAELAGTVELAPELGGLREAIEDVLARGWRQAGRLQRIHGDYHLGQVLQVPASLAGWLILDFEGEPARSLAERRRPDSPLRDVAGMLRSFDYAAFQPLLVGGGGLGRAAEERAAAWAAVAREAFLDGWQVAGEAAQSLPAFELHKALYEVRYEARYRPSWLPVPLSGISRLLARTGTTDDRHHDQAGAFAPDR